MLRNTSLFIVLALALSLAACGPYKTSPGGLKYEILADSAGDVGELGGFVNFDLMMKTSSDSVLQNTFEAGQPMWIEIFNPTYKGCIYEAFQLLSEGDSARFLIQADSFFLKTIGDTVLPEKINPKDELSFTIKVRKVYSKAYVEEERRKMEEANEERMDQMKRQIALDSAMISDYLAKNKINAQRTSQGVYIDYKKVNKQGINLIKGDSVQVHYVGRLLDGTEFDRSRGEALSLALGYRQVIPGWEDALLHMKRGEKATVYIPSALAYGDRDMGKIPPNSILVFDMEVLK